MTVEADIHTAPKAEIQPQPSPTITIPTELEIKNDCSSVLNQSDCNNVNDYDPLAILENDYSLFQDLGLPTHLASMEDID